MCTFNKSLNDLKQKKIVLLPNFHFRLCFQSKMRGVLSGLLPISTLYIWDRSKVKSSLLLKRIKSYIFEHWKHLLCILLFIIITLPSHDIPLGLDCHVMLFVKSCFTKDYQFYFTVSLYIAFLLFYLVIIRENYVL